MSDAYTNLIRQRNSGLWGLVEGIGKGFDSFTSGLADSILGVLQSKDAKEDEKAAAWAQAIKDGRNDELISTLSSSEYAKLQKIAYKNGFLTDAEYSQILKQQSQGEEGNQKSESTQDQSNSGTQTLGNNYDTNRQGKPVDTILSAYQPKDKRQYSEITQQYQSKLNSLGYDIGADGADGYHGVDTQEAVKMFQAETGLPVTGNIDQKTADAIDDLSDEMNSENQNNSIGGLLD